MPAPPSFDPPAAADDAARQAHALQLLRALGEAPVGGNRVRLLPAGPAARQSLARALTDARDHVNLQIGVQALLADAEALLRLLQRRAADGVRVNLLCADAPAEDPTGHAAGGAADAGGAAAWMARLRAAGVAVAGGALPRGWWRARRAQDGAGTARRALLVVDGRIAFVGDLDAGDDDDGAGSGTGALHLMVEGPVVRQLQRRFIAQWRQQPDTPPLLQARHFPPLAPAGSHSAMLAVTDAGGRRRGAADALLGAIATARRRVLLAEGGRGPSRAVVQALLQAAARGVAIDLLLDAAPPRGLAGSAQRRCQARLLHAGVQVHRQPAGTPAAASASCAAVIDEVWAGVGADVGDGRRAHAGCAELIVLDGGFARQLALVLQQRLRAARRVDAGPPDRPASTGWRGVLQGLASF